MLYDFKRGLAFIAECGMSMSQSRIKLNVLAFARFYGTFFITSIREFSTHQLALTFPYIFKKLHDHFSKDLV